MKSIITILARDIHYQKWVIFKTLTLCLIIIYYNKIIFKVNLA
jgi:hypothetical protein